MIQKCSNQRIFAAFAENPTKQFHVRELSRIINLAPTSINIHLKDLEKNNMIIKEKTGLYPSYKANFDDEDFRFYKRLHNLAQLKESGLIEVLENTMSPTAIVLFGSYMKGEDIETSDIDIFLIAEEKDMNLKIYEKRLKRKIQLFSADNIKKLPAELRNNIVNGVVLYGFLKVF